MILSILVIIGGALITFSATVFSYLQEQNIIGSVAIVYLLEFAKWVPIIMLFEMGISLLYRASHSGKWRAFNAGPVLQPSA